MELPQEMIMEIVLRLPVKSLIRFKCVSKSWSFLISSSSFHRWHLNRVNDSSSNGIIVYDYWDENDGGCKLISIGKGLKEDTFKESMEIDFTVLPGKFFHIKCCCDGMLCLAMADENTLVLFNPAIRVNKRLPLPPSNPSQVLWEVFGFGYDSSIGDYKVVSFQSKGDPEVVSIRSKCDNKASSYQVYVLTLTTNLWRNIGDVNPYYIRPFDSAISVNGGLHWLDMMTRNLILRFDLAEETLREVARPPIEGLGDDLFQLGHLKGSLCLYVNCALWVMKEEGELWSKIMNFIPLQNSSKCLRPLCFTNSGKFCLANSFPDELVMYDPEGQTYNKLYICASKTRGWFQSTVYTESLISPESGSGMKDID